MTDHRTPAGVELSEAHVDGLAGLRLMVILRAPGCAFALQTGGCTNCGFWHHLTTGGQAVAADDLVAQLDAALASLEPEQRAGVLQLDLFCSGSLLCDGEVPPAARPELVARGAALPALRALMVESRPEYVSAASVDPLVSAMAQSAARLELAIGLESVDPVIREQRIRKGFTLQQFEQAVAALATAGVGLVVYLLLKPLGTAEREAVQDVLASGRYLQALGHALKLPSLRVALEPTFVPHGTPLHLELQAGRFTPPSLWSVVRAVMGLAAQGLAVHVGLSSEGMPADCVPAGCPRCDADLRLALERFNATQDPGPFDGLHCTCDGYNQYGS